MGDYDIIKISHHHDHGEDCGMGRSASQKIFQPEQAGKVTHTSKYHYVLILVHQTDLHTKHIDIAPR